VLLAALSDQSGRPEAQCRERETTERRGIQTRRGWYQAIPNIQNSTTPEKENGIE
jgi:hypothetical protein